MQELNTVVLNLVRSYGMDDVVKAVQHTVDEIAAINGATLPWPAKRFTRDDWTGYSGAEVLPDGSDPVIMPVKVAVDVEDVDDENARGKEGALYGTHQKVDYVVSGWQNDQVLAGFSFSNGVTFIRVFENFQQALQTGVLLADATGPTSLALLETFGFKPS